MSSSSTPKIIDLLNASNQDKKTPLVSLEYFPPRSDEGVKNLKARMDRMRETVQPLFTDMTWGAGGSTADLSLDLALYAHQTGHVSNLHMTCTNLGKEDQEDPKETIHKALQAAYDGGIRNLVALRGDPPAGETNWTATEGGFTCALDLVQYIQAHFPNQFGIAVAGYPEGHPNAISCIDDPSTLTDAELARSSTFDDKVYCCKQDDYEKELAYLKQKVDAGADFIITQMFFDVQVYKTFVDDCRKVGIACPIVPGLMCINAYNGFAKMTKFCKTRVPTKLAEQMNALQNDTPEAVKQFGIDFGTQMCQELIDMGVPVLHFYTLNLEKVVYGILNKLGLLQDEVANEQDASTMVAKGSAWARVGDQVKTIFGVGIVQELRDNGAAAIRLQSWTMANQQEPLAIVQKGDYEKVF